MSYDFTLFRPQVGEDPMVTAERDSGMEPDTPPDAQKELLKRKVANELIAHNPHLKVFQFDYEKIAKLKNISVNQARVAHRHLELNGPDDGNGIQIMLFDNEASVTVPYWHEGATALNTFREIWNYLEIIHRETGFLIYDPQIGKVFDPSADYNTALANYVKTMQRVRKEFPSEDVKRKPWWRFW